MIEYVWVRSMNGGVTWKVDKRESRDAFIHKLENSLSQIPSLSEQPRNFLHPGMAAIVPIGIIDMQKSHVTLGIKDVIVIGFR